MFDWNRTEYTHTPAERQEDLQALAHLPAAQVTATAEVVKGEHGRTVRLHLENHGQALAFQVRAAARTRQEGWWRRCSGRTTGLSWRPGERNAGQLCCG